MHEDYVTLEPAATARLRRRMIERVLTRCETMEQGDIEPLLTLLRRFATEAAREEARMFCDELVYGVVLELRRPAGRLGSQPRFYSKMPGFGPGIFSFNLR